MIYPPILDTIPFAPAHNKVFVTAEADGSFTLKGVALNRFTRIKVDGKTLTESDFTLVAENGVLKLTFSDAFLNGLEAGAHTVDITFGAIFALFTITK